VGDNGAGKSTLLRVLAGILSPDTGTCNRDPDTTFSLLALQAGFNPYLSGQENALVSGVLLGRTRSEMKTRMDQIQELSGLGTFFDQPIRTYSTGMRSRLGFAIAYHTDPDVLLLDEILAVGDQQFKETSRRLITEIIENKKTSIIVSHSEHLLKEMCTRLIWLDKGSVHQDGSPDDVWKEYRVHYRKRLNLPTNPSNATV
jgi:lipopolysaccharide transport system ATP-binding protein